MTELERMIIELAQELVFDGPPTDIAGRCWYCDEPITSPSDIGHAGFCFWAQLEEALTRRHRRMVSTSGVRRRN
jgi:hypothetical protein